MTSFVNVFGGQTIQPAQLSLRTVALTGNLSLQWPMEIAPGQSANIAAQNMYVTPSTSGLVITMPSALVVSNGEEILWTNPSGEGFAVNDSNGGSLIAQVSGGTSRLLILRDNTTSAGTWFNVALGATASTANAAALAGLGLTVITTTLNQSHPVIFQSANFTMSAADRAQLLVWNGGAGSIQTGSASVLANNWFTILRNQGTGTITVSGPTTIDGATNLTLGVGDSTFLGTNGGVFFTFGKSLTSTSDITALSINIAPGGDTVLSSAQLAARIQTFTGTLSAAATVTYGTSPGFWLASNATNGAFTTTFRVNSLDTGVSIAQGGRGLLRSDGTNMVIGQDATQFAPGTVSAPGLIVIGSSTTGFFQNSATAGLSISVGGLEKFRNTSGHTNILQSASITGTLVTSGAITIGLGDLTLNNGSLNVSAAPGAVNNISGRLAQTTDNVDSPVVAVNATGSTWSTSSVMRLTVSTAATSAVSIIDGFSSGGDKEFRITLDGWGHADGGWVGGGADVAEFWETADGNDLKPGRTVVLEAGTFKVREAVDGDEPFGVVRPKKGGGVSFIMNAGSMNWGGKYERDAYGAIAKGADGARKLSKDYDPTREYLPRNQRPEWVLIGISGRMQVDDDAPKAKSWIKGPRAAPGVTWYIVK